MRMTNDHNNNSPMKIEDMPSWMAAWPEKQRVNGLFPKGTNPSRVCSAARTLPS